MFFSFSYFVQDCYSISNRNHRKFLVDPLGSSHVVLWLIRPCAPGGAEWNPEHFPSKSVVLYWPPWSLLLKSLLMATPIKLDDRSKENIKALAHWVSHAQEGRDYTVEPRGYRIYKFDQYLIYVKPLLDNLNLPVPGHIQSPPITTDILTLSFQGLGIYHVPAIRPWNLWPKMATGRS